MSVRYPKRKFSSSDELENAIRSAVDNSSSEISVFPTIVDELTVRYYLKIPSGTDKYR